MSQQSRSYLTGTAIATVAGISICLAIAKYRTQVLRNLKWILNYKDPLRNQQVQLISGVEECRSVMRNLKTYVQFYRFRNILLKYFSQ